MVGTSSPAGEPVAATDRGPKVVDRASDRARPLLSVHQRACLLEIARIAVTAAIGGCEESALDAAVGRAQPIATRGGVFVTVTVNGELRGCAGTIDADRPLIESTVRAAVWAANDPRFAPLAVGELARLDIAVSVLGQMTRLHDPLAFELGEEGVVVARDGRRGLLLPEVALEHGLDRTAMLETAARKAGLRPDAAWDRQTVVYAFRTLRFGAEPSSG